MADENQENVTPASQSDLNNSAFQQIVAPSPSSASVMTPDASMAIETLHETVSIVFFAFLISLIVFY